MLCRKKDTLKIVKFLSTLKLEQDFCAEIEKKPCIFSKNKNKWINCNEKSDFR